MKKTIAAILAAGMLAASLTPVSAEGTTYAVDAFNDVRLGSWYEKYVQNVYDLGLMAGVSETEFCPSETASRAMLVQILYAGAGKPSVEGMENPFRDVPDNAWYRDAVVWAYNSNVTGGTSADEFSPTACITREQAAVLLWAMQGRPEEKEDISVFSDCDKISVWAEKGVEWAVHTGILSGYTAGSVRSLKPVNSITRAELATVLSGYYRTFCGMEGTTEVQQFESADVSTVSIQSGVTVPVLMYHEVSDDVWGYNYLFVSPSSMREQLQYLQDNGYDTIFFSDLDHLEDYDKPIIITLDDGYVGNYTELYPLLKEFNMKATIFMVADTIGAEHRVTADMLKEMSDSGLVSIQSHTYTHSKLGGLTEEELRSEYQKSIVTIARITGKLPYVVSYPNGDSSELSDRIAAEYFTFGILDRGGKWTTGTTDLFNVPRWCIARSTTVNMFATAVS